MDNFIFIGYRFDVPSGKAYAYHDSFALGKNLASKGVSIDYLPGATWLTWERNDMINILHIDKNDAPKKQEVPSLYHCPIDRGDLYLWARDCEKYPSVLDLPDNHDKNVKLLMKSNLYDELLAIYKKNEIKLRWGIYMGLG